LLPLYASGNSIHDAYDAISGMQLHVRICRQDQVWRGLKTDVVYCNAVISSMEKGSWAAPNRFQHEWSKLLVCEGCQWQISSDILETMCPVLITEWGLRFETLCLVRGDLIEAKTISM